MSGPIVKQITVVGKQYTWALVYDDEEAKPVEADSVVMLDGVEYIITGGAPPGHSGSSGKVWVYPRRDGPTRSREFFPGVFNMKWDLK